MPVSDPESSQPKSPAGTGGTDHEVAVRGLRRLHDRGPGPGMLPEHGATRWVEAGRPGRVHQQDLFNPVDRQQMGRTVILTTGRARADPARVTGGEIVGGEDATDSHDNEIVDDQR